MNNNLAERRHAVEKILGCNLATTIGLSDEVEAEKRIEQFLEVVALRGDGDNLARWFDPQWVILAGGRGTRLDSSGHLNKNLDLWFGEQNALQISRSYLPGSRPHIIVVNPETAKRLLKTAKESDGVIPSTSLNLHAVTHLCGPDAIICVQPESNGPGGALQAAIPAVQTSDAEFIGIGYADQPFLNRAIFLQTLIAHFIDNADVTLCGKIPKTIVGKGGLFFDTNTKFIGTKEWQDMTDGEKTEMRQRFKRGECYTNTGITLIRRDAAIERIGRLQPHGNKSELHHVDLIRYCYDDGLKTQAYIYLGEILSGVNRWSDVLLGETSSFERTRNQLASRGVRVDPEARITLTTDNCEIGTGCYFAGRVHLSEGVKIGNYCRLEDVELCGNTCVGDFVSLKDVNAIDSIFESNAMPKDVTSPITGLTALSKIKQSHFSRARVGPGTHLQSVHANATVIPSGLSVSDLVLGVHNSPDLGLPQFSLNENASPTGDGSKALYQLALPDYIPGVFTLDKKRDTADWQNLRRHIQSHSETELISRATRNMGLRHIASKAVHDLLELRRIDGKHVIDGLTIEEIWGSVFEIVTLCTGNPDPYRQEKLRARVMAIDLLDEFSSCDWPARLKLVIAANIIDYSSTRVLAKLAEHPDYFNRALRSAIHTPLAIDCFERFQKSVIEGSPKRLIWLIDNDGEAVFDLWLIQMLLESGHQITAVGKMAPASNDATLTDLVEIIEHPKFQRTREALNLGDFSIISSGSRTVGTNLYQATSEFANALIDTDLVISKGQGNYFTTQGLKRDAFYLLLSKGITAEKSTGVISNKSKDIDALILAYVPANTILSGTLVDLCASLSS